MNNKKTVLDIQNLTVEFHVDGEVAKAVTDVSISLEEGTTLGLVGETGAGKTTTALAALRLIKCPPGVVMADTMLHAVDDVSFTIEKGKTLGVVGESGCGKTTCGRTILRLTEPTGGQVLFEGRDISKLKGRELTKLRGDMQIIFQDPFSSIDPRMSISQIIAEPIKYNKILRGKDAINARVLELMDIVGLSRRMSNSYPHELDGGRRQRVGIARALALNPKFIVCDEPVSALDVSIQAQILNLLDELQDNLGLTYMFITHDLAVVNHFADDIAVMYLGQLVEKAPAEELFDNPLHPYTKALLSAIPIPDTHVRNERIVLKGELSSPINPGQECRFAKRCLYADECCQGKAPELVEVKPGHFVACHHCGIANK